MTAQIARAFLPVQNQRAIQDALVQQINATWLAPQSPGEALSHAQQQVEEILRRTQRAYNTKAR
jgi:hypothetical protein